MSNPGTTSVEYRSMAIRWKLIDALKGGTHTMRECGTDYLPQEPAEEDLAYQNRVDRSVLYEALNDTIEKVTALPFSQPLGVTEPYGIVDDIDGMGTSLTQFTRALMNDMASYGKAHVLVDFPTVPEGMSLAEQDAAGIRPVWVHVSPQSLIAWSYENGKLASIRFKQVVTEKVDEFADARVEYVYQYTRATISKWKKNAEDDYELISAVENALGVVPLVTAYSKKTSEMCSCPPYEKLAWLNLAHWQSQSDQYNILRFARFAILFARGLADDDLKSRQAIGPTNMIRTTSDTAELKFVEHTGAAIGAGRQQLQDLQALMEVVGTQPLIERSANSTATGKAIDASRNQSEVQSWIRSLERMIIGAFALHGKWIDDEREVEVGIFSDFKVSLFGASDIDTLSKMAMAGKLSTETLLTEMQRRGIISEHIVIDDELERIENEIIITLGDLNNERQSETEPDVRDTDPDGVTDIDS